MSNNKPALIFTGGHHTSALAVAKKLRSRGWQIIWVGHRHSMAGDTSDSAEYREVTSAGIPFYELKAGKFYRHASVTGLLKLGRGFVAAHHLLSQILADHSSVRGIVSFGGYLAAPIVFSAWLRRLPIVTHEQTVVAGWANRFIAVFARKVAVSWPHSLTRYPPAKAVLTGLPIRPELIDYLSRHRSGSRPGKPVLFVFAGKQGSHAINQAVFSALPKLKSLYTVIHQTGSSSVTGDLDRARSLADARYFPRSFFTAAEFAQTLASSTVVVCRSGAHTIVDLLLFRKPAVLIPLPHTSHSEQAKNADLLASSGLALVLDQDKLNPESLLAAIAQAAKLHPGRLPEIITDGLDRLVKFIETEFASSL